MGAMAAVGFRAAALTRLHARIRACTKCVAAGHLERARPIVAGKATDRLMIVGQAPGAVEVIEGRPFAGRSGDVLRRWLAEAGIDDLPYRSAITKCFPGKAANGEGDRRPSPAEIALCAPWLERELALLRPAIERATNSSSPKVPNAHRAKAVFRSSRAARSRTRRLYVDR